MMFTARATLVLIVILLGLTPEWIAQSNSLPTLNQTNFPTLFNGDNAMVVYQAVKKQSAFFKKDEFETTALFLARVRQLMTDTKVLPNRSMLDSLTFVITDIEESYNADKSLYSIKLKPDSSYPKNDNEELARLIHHDDPLLADSFLSLGKWSAFWLATDTSKLGTIVGRTSSGAKKRFSRVLVSNAELLLYRPGFSFVDSGELSFSVPPDTARKLRGRLSVAFVGGLRYPFIDSDSTVDGATIFRPIETHNVTLRLLFHAFEVYVFDRVDGTTYFAGSMPLNQRKNPLYPSITPRPTPKAMATPTPSSVESLKILSKPRAGYTDQARKNGVQGTVELEITFLSSGQIGSITVVRGLSDGLDEQAIAAARRIIFEPKKENGVPVTVKKKLEFTFSVY